MKMALLNCMMGLFFLPVYSVLVAVSDFDIVRLDSNRWEEYKRLRLESLQLFPKNFRASYDEEAAYPDSKWQEWLKDALTEEGTIFLFAQKKQNSQVVGMAGARPGKSEKTRHLATVFSVYVAMEERGKGIAKKLVQSLLAEITQMRREVVKADLIVNAANGAARKVYEDCGFGVVATLKKELKVGDNYVDFILMEKFFER